MRIYLANVGVNASHIGRGLQSPLFYDNSFEFITIPELKPFQAWADPNLVRYADLKCFNQPTKPLADYIPARLHQTITHFDPDFINFTYGDECNRTPRAAALKKVQVGDWLFFIARLVRYNPLSNKFSGEAGFYLVGALEVAEILVEVRTELAPEIYANFWHNAHVRRGMVLRDWYDGFYVFKGSSNSRRFQVAKPFGRIEAERFLRDRNNQAWTWADHRSELQTIGSYTRTCRCVLDSARSPEEADRTALFLETFIRA
jgi:Nucleotide modification associated domain 3